MSAQALGPKWLRRIEAVIGEPVLRGWGHGGYVMNFVTPDHRHGSINKTTNEVTWHADDEVVHYTSCRETWS